MHTYDDEELNIINKGNDDYSITNSIPSNLLKNKQPRGNKSRIYTRTFNLKSTDGKKDKTVTINMHGSGDFGSYIKNAVTGVYTNHRIGSEAEYLYFLVSDCTGMDKMNGPVRLYYNSPSEYEKHQFTSVDQTKKDEWFNRVNSLKDKYL
jgi:hypothetical protein